MAPSAKVGSWLEKNKDVQPSEAYASDSDSGESEASTSAAVRKPNGSAKQEQPPVADDDDDDIEEDAYAAQADDKGREENIDWDDVLGRLKLAVGDKSKKRRQAFITRYLYVTTDCKSLKECTGLTCSPASCPSTRRLFITPLDPPALERSTTDR